MHTLTYMFYMLDVVRRNFNYMYSIYMYMRSQGPKDAATTSQKSVANVSSLDIFGASQSPSNTLVWISAKGAASSTKRQLPPRTPSQLGRPEGNLSWQVTSGHGFVSTSVLRSTSSLQKPPSDSVLHHPSHERLAHYRVPIRHAVDLLRLLAVLALRPC